MKINIHNNRMISDIQSEFSEEFPYLRIEFFSKMHISGAPTSRKYMKGPHTRLGECRSDARSGNLNIEPGMRVSDLENILRDDYGLGAQIFRKSGKIWLETSVTDDWTLEKQNNQGEALAKL